jgi:copper oxidase (laccase) domain-containing protein
VDGLITARSGVCLGIHVADCCAVYLHDRVRNCVGLVHSGRKGTELRIVQVAIQKLRDAFGSEPADIVAQLSPCIRPPHYEVDFAAEIVRQCRESGVREVFDPGVCTACNIERYYSYRAERGSTGRMLAALMLV